MQFLVAGDVWWGMEYNRDGGVWSWTAVLDPTKNPKWLDLHDRAKGVLPGLSRCIYELDGDVLRICTATGFGPRPAEFATDPDASLTVISLRRGKMPPPAGEKALVGRWVGEPVVIKGGPEERERTFTPQAEILDSYLFLMHGADEWIGGKYTVDTTKNPKWIDVELVKPLPGDEKVTKLYGCYEVADGRLKITLGARRATRPLEFKEGDMIYFDLKATKEALHPPPVASKELVPAPVPPSNPPVTTTPPSKR